MARSNRPKSEATNDDVQPWAPDPDHAPGEFGERGTSAFPGNDAFVSTNDGSVRMTTGGYHGDQPSVHSDPDAEHFLHREVLGNVQANRERVHARNEARDLSEKALEDPPAAKVQS